MAALVQPGDEVLIERPTYEPLLAVASYLGATIKRFDRRFEDDFKILPEEIETNLKRLWYREDSSRCRITFVWGFPDGLKFWQEV